MRGAYPDARTRYPVRTPFHPEEPLMKRTLTLTRERLSDLTPDELSSVAGAYYTVPACQTDKIRLLVERLTTELPDITRTCTAP